MPKIESWQRAEFRELSKKMKQIPADKFCDPEALMEFAALMDQALALLGDSH